MKKAGLISVNSPTESVYFPIPESAYPGGVRRAEAAVNIPEGRG